MPASKGKPKKGAVQGPPKSADVTESARKWMCANFFDIRTFGAVMTTGVNCGQVRGPVQVTFARSVGPILSLEHAITRKSVTTEEDADKQAKADGTITGTIGRKMTVPYGLYVARGFVSASLAAQTEFSEADVALLWQALARMFEFDRSATRGQMSARGLYVFKHESKIGNAASHTLQDRVAAKRKEGRGGGTVVRGLRGDGQPRRAAAGGGTDRTRLRDVRGRSGGGRGGRITWQPFRTQTC